MPDTIATTGEKIQYSKRLKWLLNSFTLFGLVLLLGFVLRFYNLGAKSYWVDEMYTVTEGQQSIPQMLASGRLDQPPGYYIPFHFWLQTFGISEISTRTFSALFGTGALVLIYLIGSKLFGANVGVLAAFLMAISGFQITFSQTTRFYILFEFSVLLSIFFFILTLKTQKRLYFALYVLSSIFMVYCLIFGVFILIAQNLFILFQIKKNRQILITWVICEGIIALGTLPYFIPQIFGLGGLQGTISAQYETFIPAPSLFEPLRNMVHYILMARGVRTWDGILVNYALAGLLFILGIWIGIRQQGIKTWLVSLKESVFLKLNEKPEVLNNILLVSLWLLFPILLPFLFSITVRPIYREYHTISAAPALYVLLAFVIFNFRKLVPIMFQLSVLVIMIAPSLGYYYSAEINEQWKSLASYVDTHSQPNDMIVFVTFVKQSAIQQVTFDYYSNSNLPECVLSDNIYEDPDIKETLVQCLGEQSKFWLVIPEHASRSREYFLNSNQADFLLIKEQNFVGLSAYLYELKK